MSFDRDQMQARAVELAAVGVYVGTSSWKYEGWLGQLYTADRYEYRDKLAKTRFERDCSGAGTTKPPGHSLARSWDRA